MDLAPKFPKTHILVLKVRGMPVNDVDAVQYADILSNFGMVYQGGSLVKSIKSMVEANSMATTLKHRDLEFGQVTNYGSPVVMIGNAPNNVPPRRQPVQNPYQPPPVANPYQPPPVANPYQPPPVANPYQPPPAANPYQPAAAQGTFQEPKQNQQPYVNHDVRPEPANFHLINIAPPIVQQQPPQQQPKPAQPKPQDLASRVIITHCPDFSLLLEPVSTLVVFVDGDLMSPLLQQEILPNFQKLQQEYANFQRSRPPICWLDPQDGNRVFILVSCGHWTSLRDIQQHLMQALDKAQGDVIGISCQGFTSLEHRDVAEVINNTVKLFLTTNAERNVGIKLMHPDLGVVEILKRQYRDIFNLK